MAYKPKEENRLFIGSPLPIDLQVAPVFCFLAEDIDNDGKNEILTAGNMTKTKVKLGRLNGNHGIVLQNTNASLVPMDYSSTGICVREDVRQIVILKTGGNIIIGYLSHEGKSHFYRVNSPEKK